MTKPHHYYSTIPLTVSIAIHLLPLPGVLGSSALERLYGFRIDDAEKKDDDKGNDEKTAGLSLALRHRAIMLGSLGIGLGVGTFWHPPSLGLAIATTTVSDVSFLALALPSWKRLNAKFKKVVYADIVSILCLGAAAIAIDGERK